MSKNANEPWAAWAEQMQKWMATPGASNPFGIGGNSPLGGANPFDYLTELERHAGELASAPQHWMPWNYRATCDRILAPTS